MEKPILDKFRVVDADCQSLDKPFKTGELWIKGDAFFKEYLRNPEKTKGMLFKDG